MNEIDQLTLKMLTSKKRYNNYLASANPEKSAEIEEYNQKVQKYVPQIKKLIGKYLENPETQTSNDIDDVIESCFKILIKHFEMQEYEEKCAKHGYDATDSSEEEETLFKEDEDEDEDEEEGLNDESLKEEVLKEEVLKEEVLKDEVLNKPKSYWGKNISKSSTLDHFIKKR
jgi:hypothetical protein